MPLTDTVLAAPWMPQVRVLAAPKAQVADLLFAGCAEGTAAGFAIVVLTTS
jgi:hypothetical protein